METITTVVAFVGILVVLVLVHELGHFFAAKRAGITVEEFGIGFPPRIASITWHGTRYSLNWIPSAASCECWARTATSRSDGCASRGSARSRSRPPWPVPSTADRSGCGWPSWWPACS